MEITDIRIRQTTEEGRMKAVATVTFDATLAVHDIKIIQGSDRLFLAMPSRRMPDGSYRDIVHPIHPAFRAALEEAVLTQYERLTQDSEQGSALPL